MRGCFLTKAILSCLLTYISMIGSLAKALPDNLKSAVDYAFTHHPTVLHAKLDLDKINYDVLAEEQYFLPKLFLQSDVFFEHESCYQNQGLTLGPLMHWQFVTGTKVTGNIGIDLSKNHPDVSRARLYIKQPLLKHVGKKINQNNLIQTTIQKDILFLNYDIVLEDLIMDVSSNYFNYAQLVLAQRRQSSGLEQAKKYLNQVNFLVETGRLPKNESEQPALYVETQESQLEESKQRLAFHYLMLLQSMGVVTDTSTLFEASDHIESRIATEIEALLVQFKNQYAKTLQPNFLPIDKEEKLFQYQKKIIDQNTLVAKDQTKWDMNLEGYAAIRQRENQYGLSLSLDLPLNDKLKRYQSVYHLKVEKDKLNDNQVLHDFYYPKKITFERQEVESKLKQLALTLKMKELSEKSLKTAELKWQVGRTTLFELIQLSNQYQQSELDLIKAKVNVLNAGFSYFKLLGVLPNFWVH